MMRLMSPRSTAPYQTLDSSSSVTSPMTVAPGTTHALEWMVGPFFKRATMPAKILASTAPTTSMRPPKKPPANDVRLAFYVQADPYSYAPLQAHPPPTTHV